MVTLRCTRKLLRRLAQSEQSTAPTTVLGDWYANVLFSRPQQLVLCVSERSLLPVVLPAKETNTLASRLSVAVGEMLQRLDVAPALIEREQTAMRDFAYGRTQNRRVLGSLNDLMFQLSWYLRDRQRKVFSSTRFIWQRRHAHRSGTAHPTGLLLSFSAQLGPVRRRFIKMRHNLAPNPDAREAPVLCKRKCRARRLALRYAS